MPLRLRTLTVTTALCARLPGQATVEWSDIRFWRKWRPPYARKAAHRGVGSADPGAAGLLGRRTTDPEQPTGEQTRGGSAPTGGRAQPKTLSASSQCASSSAICSRGARERAWYIASICGA